MPRALKISLVLTAFTLILSGIFLAPDAISESYETAPVFLNASDLLPPELISGVNYTVRSTVVSDGFINTYDVDTLYGALRLESTVLLMKRIGELNALSRIQQLKGTSVYLSAAGQVAAGPVRTAEGLVQNPVGTVSGIASGIGKFLGGVGNAVSGDQSQDGGMSSLLGQASYKRQYAYEFSVDPYTSYEPLQKALNDIAWTAAAGGLTVKAAFMAIPGGAGLALGLTGTADSVRAMVRDKTPAELADINQNSLMAMGVPGPVIQSFMLNTVFDPQEQTLLVSALSQMPGVANVGVYIQTASMAAEESVAVFLRTRAQLMQLYNANATPVQSFVNAAGVPVLQTVNGKIVAIFPLDYIAWTPGFARKAMAVTDVIKGIPGVKGKEFLVTGKVSPTARKAMEARGWKVEERIERKLLGS